MKFNELEKKRAQLQFIKDKGKTLRERNILGQFSTPVQLATDILRHANNFLPKEVQINFLDPAIGTGVFYSALCQTFSSERIASAIGFEVDPFYGEAAQELWSLTNLNYIIDDFTKQDPKENKYNLIICNPPYVRHHHIKDKKKELQDIVLKNMEVKISGLAGLYCYFILLAHKWMEKDGVAGWLVPSEFMDVNYGNVIKKYLLENVTLLQIHRFEPSDVQFDDALVSTAIVWFRNSKPEKNHSVQFTYGGNIETPLHTKSVNTDVLKDEHKWTRFPLLECRDNNHGEILGDYFDIRRGIATGDNKFFILSKEEIKEKGLSLEYFRPILPSPRYLKNDRVLSDACNNPLLDKELFVLDCNIPMDIIEKKHPFLYSYLVEGINKGVSERYLCKTRRVWYTQENRPPSRFYCTYIGRSGSLRENAFRFIFNQSNAIVNNSYLILYPKGILLDILNKHPELNEKVFDVISGITDEAMMDEGRIYGGGMRKMEPMELAKVSVSEIAKILEQYK